MKKIRKLSKLIFQNLGWKILSVAAAIILWIICINVADPVSNQQFITTLKLINEERVTGPAASGTPEAVLVNGASLRGRSVAINIRATRRTLSELNRDRSKISAYIDLGQFTATGKPQSARVAYDLTGIESEQYTVSGVEPAEVEVLIEPYITKSFPILLGKQSGEAGEGYVALTPVITPANVSIGGAASLINSVASVRVDVSVADAAQNIEQDEKLYILNTSGMVMSDPVDLQFNTARVFVTVNKYGTIPIENPRITGNVASGYSIAGVSFEPKEAEVVGPEQDVDALSSIQLNTINVNNWSQTHTEVFELSEYLADTNLTIREETPAAVEVTITVAREAVKTFIVPIEQLHIRGMSTEVVFLDKDVSLTVKGLERNINAIVPEELNGVIDISGLTPGTYRVPVEFTLPSGVMAVGTPAEVGVTISDGQPPLPEDGAEDGAEDGENPAEEDSASEENPEETENTAEAPPEADTPSPEASPEPSSSPEPSVTPAAEAATTE
ncbi:MAG: hypothetical protein LBS62_02080 [Clostridiales bacterium]|jgi:YbbR domain-containing protein|nr:hypothetical protein [Clostridiales bacterium]